MEILELKSTIFGIKHSLDGIKRYLAIPRESISDFEDRSHPNWGTGKEKTF